MVTAYARVGDGYGAYVNVVVEIGPDGRYHPRADRADIQAALDEASQTRRGAEARAKGLFVRLLSDKQRKTFTDKGYIEVTGASGCTYRIECGGGYSGNVLWVQGRNVLGRFCAHPGAYQGDMYVPLPRHDAFLGQLLLISTDEKKFLQKAVYSRAHRPGAARPGHVPRRPGLLRRLGFGL